MSESIVRVLRQRIQTTHAWLLQVTDELTEEQLAWVPSPTAPPIRWHIWHTARCADQVQADFPRAAVAAPPHVADQREIWRTENLAARWELDPSQLGPYENGAEMDDHLAATLRLPEKAVLLAYCRSVFEAFERAIDELRIEQFDEAIEGVGFELSHASRHLGMIEALRGAQQLHGTATV